MATSPATQTRAAVKSILDAEFAGEFKIKNGRLHPAHPGPAIGVSPAVEQEGRRVLDQDTAIQVQIFLAWTAQVRPDFVVDPAEVEAVVQRFREALYSATHPYAGTSGLWDFRMQRVDYEPDPVGQMTRATVTIVAMGQNYGETSA